MTKRQPPSKHKTSPPPSPRKSDGDADGRGYRSCVGIALFNAEGRIFVGERLDNSGAWQMPQGGIDGDESPEIAVFREMEEEVGTRDARIIGIMDEWLRYDLPERTAKRLWGGKYRGQQQKWIALEFLGEDGDIDLETHHDPEFSQWKWVPISDLLDYVVPFKRDIYRRVMDEFAPLARELSGRKKPRR